MLGSIWRRYARGLSGKYPAVLVMTNDQIVFPTALVFHRQGVIEATGTVVTSVVSQSQTYSWFGEMEMPARAPDSWELDIRLCCRVCAVGVRASLGSGEKGPHIGCREVTATDDSNQDRHVQGQRRIRSSVLTSVQPFE